MKLLKKAYQTNNHFLEPWFWDLDKAFYGTIGQAKSEALAEYQDAELEGGNTIEGITDIRLKRYKEMDIVELEGEQLTRQQAEQKLEFIKKREALRNHPSTLFLRQHTREYVGNAMGFWAKNARGYTIHPENAHIYTKEELLEDFSHWSDHDYFIPVEAAKAATMNYVESQRVKDRI